MAYDIKALDELIDMVQKRPIVGGLAPRDFIGNPIAPRVEDAIRDDHQKRLAAIEGMTLEEIKAMVAGYRAAAGED